MNVMANVAVLIQVVVVLFCFTIVAFILLIVVLKRRVKRERELLKSSTSSTSQQPPSIGFLHPHALSGGGGERVLWSAISATMQAYPTSPIILYSIWPSNESETKLDMMKKTSSHFGIELPKKQIEIVDISDISSLADAKRYPRLTLLLQAIGTMILGTKAYVRRPTDIYIDTANLTFGLCVPNAVFEAHTMSYVHYPTVSSDMLLVVQRRETGVHNSGFMANSTLLTWLKVEYYKLFAHFYAFVAWIGVDVVVANSTWTANHLKQVWKLTRDVPVVFPPCPVVINDDDMEIKKDDGLVVSVGQFRPEKRHEEQVRIMERMSSTHPDAELIMIGGARDSEDEQRALGIRQVATSNVHVRVNVSREEMRQVMRKASVGLHTMRYEHFGIGVVEVMAAGVIVVAHGSGGVADDIITDGVNGFLANDEDEFVAKLCKVLRMSCEEKSAIRRQAVASCQRFSDDGFQQRFTGQLARCVGAWERRQGQDGEDGKKEG